MVSSLRIRLQLKTQLCSQAKLNKLKGSEWRGSRQKAEEMITKTNSPSKRPLKMAYSNALNAKPKRSISNRFNTVLKKTQIKISSLALNAITNGCKIDALT